MVKPRCNWKQEITKRLQSYISEPEVTVIVTDSKSQRVNIMGMVTKPGAYLLTSSTTVLDAIAMAGGFKDFAKQKSIYVLRQAPDGTQKQIPFNYKEVIKGQEFGTKHPSAGRRYPGGAVVDGYEHSTLFDPRVDGGRIAGSLDGAGPAFAELNDSEFQR